MTNSKIIFCTRQLRAEWPRPLAEGWHAQYPHIFDSDDLRLALSQSQNHFVEWFVAIYLFHRDRAHSLIEKYAYLNHAGKRRILRTVLNHRQLAAVDQMRDSIGVQPPDLFVFVPGERFWFAEAKGLGDRLSAKQRQSHKVITERLGVPVEIFNVRICDNTRRGP